MNSSCLVNDVHSQLNPTQVSSVAQPGTTGEVATLVRAAAASGEVISICGSRHAMGGQQFGHGTRLLDSRRLTSIGPVDRARGLVECGAGVQWPALVAELHRQQADGGLVWSIRQKQTGADDLTLGGALSANAHGRGLLMRPFVDDIEAFTLVDADGESRRCSRTENPGLFRLVIGGYGCFGVVTSLCLRLSPRRQVVRTVELINLNQLLPRLAQRLATGHQYGDFQFSIDEASPDFLHRGVFSCYRPIQGEVAMPADQNTLRAADWENLVYLAHTDRARAFSTYCRHYESTHGQLYWSDTHQLSLYLNHYHEALDRRLGVTAKGSEMISELYVPRAQLGSFMARAAAELRPRRVPVIYGTIRFIERDDETLLAWARADWACVIFNLHTEHTPGGIAQVADAFRSLTDVALSCGGTYFLTYHRWARRDQVERAHPQFVRFLAEKSRHDPAHRFQSEWWRHYHQMFSASHTGRHAQSPR